MGQHQQTRQPCPRPVKGEECPVCGGYHLCLNFYDTRQPRPLPGDRDIAIIKAEDRFTLGNVDAAWLILLEAAEAGLL